MDRKLWCVVYRTGGTDRFTWHRTLAVSDKEQAMEQKRAVERQGYHCFVEDFRRSMTIGLPETF